MIDIDKIKSLTLEFIKAIGEDPTREGLKETPERVAKMCKEIFAGLEKPPENMIKTFTEDLTTNNIVEIPNIPVNSVCEHHLLPFVGTATVKYIPNNGKIMGLSKFVRVVDYFSRRPQVQERLTKQIAEFLFSKLSAKYVEVILECEHMCMTMRGVKTSGIATKTVYTCGNT